MENARKIQAEIASKEKDTVVLCVSVAEHVGMNDIRLAILNLVEQMEREGQKVNSRGETVSSGSILTSKKESSSINPSFLETRSVDEDAEIQFPGSEN